MHEGIVLSCSESDGCKRVYLKCDSKVYVFDRMKGDKYWKAVPQAPVLRGVGTKDQYNVGDKLNNRYHFDGCDNYSLVVLKTIPGASSS